jgi:hypothetical protein
MTIELQHKLLAIIKLLRLVPRPADAFAFRSIITENSYSILKGARMQYVGFMARNKLPAYRNGNRFRVSCFFKEISDG